MADYHKLTQIALFLSLFVIMLGAYTRLTDAGLGCPDWPGCYGRMVLPSSGSALDAAQQTFPEQLIVPHKAWAEMVHRYVAGTLGVLILILAGWALVRRRHDVQQPIVVPLLLVGLLVFQAVLGMWTVTWKLLPLVVTGHLLGGMAIAALLCWLMMATRPAERAPAQNAWILRPWIWAGLIIVALQLFLGAWTSTNYAALACPDFPYCQDHAFPMLDWKHAFNLLRPVGPNYEGGVLDMNARMTIHMVHRYWAFLTFIYLLPLSLVLIFFKGLFDLRILGFSLLIFLALQITLGILNVILQLPLAVAVAHNVVAVLLFITIIALLQRLYDRRA